MILQCADDNCLFACPQKSQYLISISVVLRLVAFFRRDQISNAVNAGADIPFTSCSPRPQFSRLIIQVCPPFAVLLCRVGCSDAQATELRTRTTAAKRNSDSRANFKH